MRITTPTSDRAYRPDSALAVVRASLPSLVRASDLAIHLPNLTEEDAKTLLVNGFAGPPLMVGEEPVVPRARVFAAIEQWSETGLDLLRDGLQSSGGGHRV